MKERKRSIICLALALLMLLSLPAAAAGMGSGTLILMQNGAPGAIVGGAFTDAPAPYDASNGAIMVPLRFAAEALGAEVSWDAESSLARISYRGIETVYTAGSWACLAGGVSIAIGALPELRDGEFYVPLLSLSALPGVYVHSFGYYDGGFLAISNQPLTEGDQSGAPNQPFDATAPDPVLAACRETALLAFGPNAGLFDHGSLVLRLGSRFARTAGDTGELCAKGGSIAPLQSGDGYLMIPIAYCAQVFGGTYTRQADGSSTVVCRGRTAVFPAKNGVLTLDGQQLEHPYFGGLVQDGTAYCSVYSFTRAFGLWGYYDQTTQGILLSPWDVSARPELQQRAWASASQLTPLRWENAKGFIALTFDDGPSGSITARLLDGLKARDVHATFFLCNYRIQAYPELLQRYIAEGHEVANHSATHATLTACSAAGLASEIDRTNSAIVSKTGSSPVLLRPPGGAYNQAVLSALRSRGMSCVLWSVDPQDWKYRNTETVVRNVLSAAGDGDIVLLHDMYNSSVDAALSIIDTLQARGYCFVTVSELAQYKGVSLLPGVVYTRIS